MHVSLNIRDFLDRASHACGDRVAIVDEPGATGSLGALTYGELAHRAKGMAVALDNMGVAAGERVAIASPNSARFLISFFGVSGYGRALVPINFRLNAQEVGFIVEHSGASVLLLDPELTEHLGDINVKHRVALDGVQDAELFAPVDDGPIVPEQAETTTASINYTSGTTAQPKGVELVHRGLWLNAATLGWHLGVSERDVYLHTLPMFHCNGWGLPYATVGVGARQVVLRKVDGEEILRRVDEHGVTLLCGAPTVVSMILDAADRYRDRGQPVPGRGRVRMVVAGAPPPSATIERVEAELGWEFIQIYGLTETSPLLTINRAGLEWDGLSATERARRLSRAGVPAVGVRLRTDETGEVLARSNHVFKRYWRQPVETATVIKDGWFHTGDGGYLDGDYLSIRDRKKDVIISGGENVSSIEVEDCLHQHPAISDVAVIGVPDSRWGETVRALVVLKGGAAVDESEIMEFCRQRLAHFKCPTGVGFVDSLPRTATGKLQKFKLRQRYGDTSQCEESESR